MLVMLTCILQMELRVIAFVTKLISLVGITGEGEIEFLSAKFC
jgi:hypothetical protein